jgi:anti-sigma regulatory factor (Ser/Thr protein kinase)
VVTQSGMLETGRYGEPVIVVAEYRAQFPSAVASVGKARRAITAFAREWFSGEDLTDIESAAGEALANCAEHGHRRGQHIDVRCYCDNERLSIEIRDSGAGFDYSKVAVGVVPPSDAPRGHGVSIMRRLMDEIEYTERGTRLRLVKRVPPARSVSANGVTSPRGVRSRP